MNELRGNTAISLITYIDHLQKANVIDLAFYPLTVLENALEQHQVVFCYDNDSPAGYLWHGPVKPGKDTVIYQACVDYDSRKRHLGWGMVSQLIQLNKTGNATGIRLRCASSSESNEFWRMIGFYCTNVTSGGIRRKRDINHWRTDTQTPLFVLDPVTPSDKPMDETEYFAMRRAGQKQPSRFGRRHYG